MGAPRASLTPVSAASFLRVLPSLASDIGCYCDIQHMEPFKEDSFSSAKVYLHYDGYILPDRSSPRRAHHVPNRSGG